MAGREHMVRNEIAVLRKISMGHESILTLVDYFETVNSRTFYSMIFLTCSIPHHRFMSWRRIIRPNMSKGELLRIRRRKSRPNHCRWGIIPPRPRNRPSRYPFPPKENANIDLKPENLLFRTPAENSDLLIADFGLSRIIDEESFHVLTTTCGTPGYMAPEIFKKSGHGKPVDIWALGVITYFLLCGYTPFDRDSSVEEMQAIMNGDYSFDPPEYWEDVSDKAKDFIKGCLTVDPKKRLTAKECVSHPWLSLEEPVKKEADLLPNVRSNFNARRYRPCTVSVNG